MIDERTLNIALMRVRDALRDLKDKRAASAYRHSRELVKEVKDAGASRHTQALASNIDDLITLLS